jgi:hypothetical protein
MVFATLLKSFETLNNYANYTFKNMKILRTLALLFADAIAT